MLLHSQADGVVLEVSHFVSSVYKAVKHLVSVLQMLLHRVGRIYLMMYVQPVFLLVQKEVET